MTAAATFIRLAKFQTDALHGTAPSLFITQDFHRIGQYGEQFTLFLGMMNLLMACRELSMSVCSLSRNAHKVYIVCEGSEDEEKYFSFFEGLSSNLKLMERAEACFLAEDRKYTLDYMDRDED